MPTFVVAAIAIAASIVTAGAAAAAFGVVMTQLTIGTVMVGALGGMVGSIAGQLASGQGLDFGQIIEAGAVGGLTAGAFAELSNAGLGFSNLQQAGTQIANGTFSAASIPQLLETIGARGVVSAGIDTTIEGGSFGQALEGSVISDVGAVGAGTIGAASTTNSLLAENTPGYVLVHAALGCVLSAAEGSGCAGGAIGGAAGAALTPFVANAITGGDPNITSGQTAAIAGIATLTGGLFAGLAGQNAMAGANAAQNEALNNCLGHPESCLQMAKNALSSASNTATNAFNQLAFHLPDNVVAATNAGADVPAMESATNLDLLKGMGNAALNLPSFSFPGMPDYKTVFQYSNPTVGGIGEMYGLGGLSELGTGLLSRNGGTTTLYRAVSPEEYHSIMSTGQFSFAPGAGEMKQFGFNLNEVMNYANTAPEYAAIVRAEIPSSLLGTFGVSNSIDPFIFRSGVLTVEKQEQLNLFNSVVKNIGHAY